MDNKPHLEVEHQLQVKWRSMDFLGLKTIARRDNHKRTQDIYNKSRIRTEWTVSFVESAQLTIRQLGANING